MENREYTPEELKRMHEIMLSMLKDFDAVCRKYDIRYYAAAGTALGAIRHHGFIPWDDDLDVAMFRPDYERFVKIWKKELGEKYTLYSPEEEHKYYNFVPVLSKNGTKYIVPLAKDYFEIGVSMDIFLYENIPDDPKEGERFIKKCFFWRNLYVSGRANFHYLWKGSTLKQKGRYTIAAGIRFFSRIFDKDGTVIRKQYMKEIRKFAGKTKTYSILGDPYADKCTLTEEEAGRDKEQIYLPFEDYEIPVFRAYDTIVARRYGADYMQLPPKEMRVNHCPLTLDLGDDYERNV